MTTPAPRPWRRVALAVVLAVSQLAAGAKPFISRKDKMEIRDAFTVAVQQKLRAELRLAGVPADQEAAVSVQLTFDEDALARDAEAWAKARASEAAKGSADAAQSVRKNVAELMASAKAEREKEKEEQAREREKERAREKAEREKERQAREKAAASPDKGGKDGPAAGGERFGRLNVDISQTTLDEILRLSEAPAAPLAAAADDRAPSVTVLPPTPSTQITLALPMPTAPVLGAEPYPFKAADYLAKATVEVTVPAATPQALRDKIPAMVVALLDLASLGQGADAKSWVTVAVAPPVAEKAAESASPATFLKGIWQPGNLFLGVVAMAVIMGAFLALAASLLGRSLQSASQALGKDITTLKPAEAAAEKAEADGGAAAVIEAEAAPDPAEGRGHFDANATSQALTREMRTIRDQVTALVAENAFVCAEYLRDLLFAKGGMAAFQDFLGFMGYAPLKPALDLLPRAAVEQFQAFVEENRDAATNLLNGAEIAQKMYGDCVAKATLRGEGSAAFDGVRAALIKTDDAVVAKFLADASPAEVAVLLRTLTVERGNRLMKAMPGATLKEAAKLLDGAVDGQDAVAQAVAGKLSELQASMVEQSQAQRRLILRLVKSITVAEEAGVYDLIAPDDWDLKRQIMGSKLFLRDAVYVPEKTMKQALIALPIALRGEVLFVADEALAKAIRAALGQGNKQAEMLEAEVTEIGKNPKKADEARARATQSLEQFAAALRRAVGGDKRVIDQIIRAQCQALGLTPPDGIAPAEAPSAAA